MKLGEKILLLLSRSSGTALKAKGKFVCWGEDRELLDNPLSLLCKMFPGFEKIILGNRIVDFGCGPGRQSGALAMGGAEFVLGIDSNPIYLERVRALSRRLRVTNKVEFTEMADGHEAKYDMVISQNAIEHFANPASIINQMQKLVDGKGKIFITFGPLWYSPYGAHMNFFTKVPWINILFSEKTVLDVRALFRTNGAKKYQEVTGGLNKMTVAKFEWLIARSGMNVEFKRYNCMFGLNFIGRIPVLRELFTYQISCILRP